MRSWCSNPPVHGARIVAEVVGDEATFNEWRAEMEGMAGRIKVHPLSSCCLIAPPHPLPSPSVCPPALLRQGACPAACVVIRSQFPASTRWRNQSAVRPTAQGAAQPVKRYVSSFQPVAPAPQRSCRMQTVRQELYDHLARINPDKDWSFIVKQARQQLPNVKSPLKLHTLEFREIPTGPFSPCLDTYSSVRNLQCTSVSLVWKQTLTAVCLLCRSACSASQASRLDLFQLACTSF